MNSNTDTADQANRSIQSFIQDHEFSDFPDRQLNKESSIKAEAEEQQRRIDDADQESARRSIAKKVSAMFPGHLQTKSSSFLASVKDSLQTSKAKISEVQVIPTKKLGKGWSIIRAKVSGAKNSPQWNRIIFRVRARILNSAARIAHLVDSLIIKGHALGHFGGQKLQIASEKASDKTLVITAKVRDSMNEFQLASAVEGAKTFAKTIGATMSSGWSKAVRKSILANAENKERKRRLSDENEGYALFNALAVSSLIKELAPALYRPDAEPNRWFLCQLLESTERNRRIQQHKRDITLASKSAKVAKLIKDHKENLSKELLPSYEKVQIITTPAIEELQIFETRRDVADLPEIKAPAPVEVPVHRAISASM